VVFDDLEREALVELLFKMSRFCGVEILTYCVMNNHFHALLRVPDRASWRRVLMFGVAEFFGVFALYTRGTQRAHLLGRYRDVVAAEYLIAISMARIDRECEAHIRAWRVGVAPTGAMTRREQNDFRASAARGFAARLRTIAREEGHARPAREQAEEFARDAYARRGGGWRTMRVGEFRPNAAGFALGASMEVLHGVDGGEGGGPSGLLGATAPRLGMEPRRR
jgi:hypothetical protein